MKVEYYVAQTEGFEYQTHGPFHSKESALEKAEYEAKERQVPHCVLKTVALVVPTIGTVTTHVEGESA